jgi:hypothetical protein
VELTVESVAAYVQGDKPTEPLIEQLRAEPDKADAILTAFASSRSFDRQSWVSWAAPQVLPHDRAVALLTKLAGAGDPDVRDDALFTLLAFDRSAAMKLVPHIRRNLHSKDIYEPVAAMWMLGRLGVSEASEEILDAAEQSEYPFHRLVAEAVTLFIRRDTKEIARLIEVRGRDALHLVGATEKLDDPELARIAAEWVEKAEARVARENETPPVP